MNASKRIDQITKLRVRTTERAASVAEEESAALAIGKIIMREPELVVMHRESTETPKLAEPSPDVVLDDVLIKAETEKAILCAIPSFGETWIPRSQIRGGNEVYRHGDFGRLVITSWLAKRKGILAA